MFEESNKWPANITFVISPQQYHSKDNISQWKIQIFK